MTVRAEQIGKRYNRDWIFRNLTHIFSANHSYAILGPNGSGKSTLLKAISGFLTINEGQIEYHVGEKPIPREHIFRHIAYTAPYIELPEELTVKEAVAFQRSFKPFRGLSDDEVIDRALLTDHSDKPIQDLSSGMRQRLKVTLAVLSDAPILLLDEPATNLDTEGLAWMKQLVQENSQDRVVLLASNRPDEYEGCTDHLDIRDAKPVTN